MADEGWVERTRAAAVSTLPEGPQFDGGSYQREAFSMAGIVSAEFTISGHQLVISFCWPSVDQPRCSGGTVRTRRFLNTRLMNGELCNYYSGEP